VSYSTIYQSSSDYELNGRIIACCADENAAEPETAAAAVKWAVVTASDVAAAYESAVLAGNEHPGGDPAVITDQMILSNVQANLPAP
jgi:hypothetical protein